MSKIQAFLKAFYTALCIDDAKRWLYVQKYSVALPYKDRKVMTQKRNLVAKEARALRVRSHGSGKPEWNGGYARCQTLLREKSSATATQVSGWS